MDAADLWEQQVMTKCAKAMAVWLKGSVRLTRPINSLTKDELEKMAIQAVHTWIVEASHRISQPIAPDEHKKLKTLLFS
jgi:hypothetical protein